jgi:hypothetical protein
MAWWKMGLKNPATVWKDAQKHIPLVGLTGNAKK